MALLGTEILQVLGISASGQAAGEKEATTTGAIAALAGANPPGVKTSGATLTLTQAANGGQTILLGTATGNKVTLPGATGSGVKFKFVVTTTVTSNAHKILSGGAADYFQGNVFTEDSATVTGYNATPAGTYLSIAMNGTTTGGFIGDELEFQDIAANLWQVNGITKSTGTAATPFSTSAT
ncbi:MAG: hypothetical protein WCD70_15190 [Alphaproteobacteria bacterium]